MWLSKPLISTHVYNHLVFRQCSSPLVLLAVLLVSAWRKKESLDTYIDTHTGFERLFIILEKMRCSLPSFLASYSSTRQTAGHLLNKEPRWRGRHTPSISTLQVISSQLKLQSSPQDRPRHQLVWLCMQPCCAQSLCRLIFKEIQKPNSCLCLLCWHFSLWVCCLC